MVPVHENPNNESIQQFYKLIGSTFAAAMQFMYEVCIQYGIHKKSSFFGITLHTTRKSVITCIENMHGNHVIQKCVENMPPDTLDFVIGPINERVEFVCTHMCPGRCGGDRACGSFRYAGIQKRLCQVLFNCFLVANNYY